MSRNFYIADMHLGHRNCIHFDDRPFASVEEMDEEMIRRWNRKVGKDDHVYILGDFTYRNGRDVSDYARQLRGHKHLIYGNHDKRSDHYRECFVSADDILKINDTVYGQERQVILCHYWIPFAPWQSHGAYMLHGHTHKSRQSVLEEEMKQNIRDNGYRCEAFNVGCMWQDYAPQTLEEIVERQAREVVI